MKALKILILLSLFSVSLYAAKQPERKDIRTGNKEYKKGSYNEAELSYRRAMEKSPTSANAKFNLGNALYKQVDTTMAQTAPDEAKQLQEQVRKLYENAAETYSDNQQKAAAHYNEGNTYLREQNWQAAIEAYKKSLRLNPNDIEAKQNLVFAQAMNNQQPPQQQQQKIRTRIKIRKTTKIKTRTKTNSSNHRTTKTKTRTKKTSNSSSRNKRFQRKMRSECCKP